MRVKNSRYAPLALGFLGAVVWLTACTQKVELPEAVEKKINDIQATNEKILAKLDTIKAPAAGQQQQQQQPGRPDPTKVYAVPVGTSVAKGPETAKVTIVESSEFQ